MTIIEQAILEVEQGNTEEGLMLLEGYELEADDDEKFSIAQLYHQWGLVNKAIKLYLELSLKYPDESIISLYLAEIYIDIEEDEKAIDLLNNIEENDEHFVQALLQLADLYQSQSLFEVAEQKLFLAKQILPNEPIIDFALGELAFSNGEYQKSISFYERVVKQQGHFNEIDINLRLAEALSATGKWEEALEYYQEINEDDHSPEILFRYGLSAYRSERHDIAITLWEKLLSVDSEYHSVYLLLATAYQEEGLLDNSYEIANRGLEVDELNKELHNFLGHLATNLGEIQKAKTHLQQAIAIDPGYKEAVIALIELFKKEEEYEMIKELINELQRYDEIDPIYKWELAKANYELEEYQLALNNYDEAYTFFTSDVDFLKEYGYILVEEGRLEKAKQVFGEYLTLEPADVEVEEFLFRLE